jgi:hypothetical protein
VSRRARRRQAAHLPPPHAQRRRVGRVVALLERAARLAERQARRPHLDAAPPRVVHERGHRVEAHRLRVEQRAVERRRVVRLEPRRGVGDEREAPRVALGEAVVGEHPQVVGEPAATASSTPRAAMRARSVSTAAASRAALRWCPIVRRSSSASAAV